MWEKISKVQAQVVACMIILIGCFGFIYLLAIKEVPPGNQRLVDILGGIVLGSSITGAIGWLFTQSKHNSNRTNTNNNQQAQ